MDRQKKKLVGTIRMLLLANNSPRLTMFTLLLFTSVFGFGVSVTLAFFGITSMPIRYGISVICSYGAFFLGVYTMIEYYLFINRDETTDMVETIEEQLDTLSEFADIPIKSEETISTENTDSIFDFNFDFDDAIGLLVVLSILLIFFVFGLYYIYIAPAFFSEIIADIFLSGLLYKKVKSLQKENWSENIFLKTIWPFSIIFFLFTILGFILQKIDPTAITLGDFLKWYL